MHKKGYYSNSGEQQSQMVYSREGSRSRSECYCRGSAVTSRSAFAIASLIQGKKFSSRNFPEWEHIKYTEKCVLWKAEKPPTSARFHSMQFNDAARPIKVVCLFGLSTGSSFACSSSLTYRCAKEVQTVNTNTHCSRWPMRAYYMRAVHSAGGKQKWQILDLFFIRSAACHWLPRNTVFL